MKFEFDLGIKLEHKIKFDLRVDLKFDLMTDHIEVQA